MNKTYIAAAAAASFDYDLRSCAGLNGLGDIVAADSAYAQRGSPWEHRNQCGRWVRLAGLRTAADNATDRLGKSAGISFPWNLNKGYKGWCEFADWQAADEAVESWKRWTGWLLATDEHPENFPLLVAFMKATQTHRGLGSPYLGCNLRPLVEKFCFSPGKLERELRAVEWQANRFLRGFGIQFSRKRDWEQMAAAISPRYVRDICGDHVPQRDGFKPSKLGKKLAAFIVNARLKRMCGEDLGGGRALGVLIKARGFSQIRPTSQQGTEGVEWVHPFPREVVRWAVERVNAGEFCSLAEALSASDRLVRDTTDGVVAYLDPTTTQRIHGVDVIDGYHLLHRGRRVHDVCPVFVLRSGTRSFHYAHGGESYRRKWIEVPGGGWREIMVPIAREAVQVAVRAWKAQDAASEAVRDAFPSLIRSDVTILVTRRDSYNAGNCEAGTESWIDFTGVGRDRWCVPASALMAHAHDHQVARVLAVANKAAGEWLRRHIAA